MQTFLRLTLLGIFGALGIAAAVGLAWQAESPSEEASTPASVSLAWPGVKPGKPEKPQAEFGPEQSFQDEEGRSTAEAVATQDHKPENPLRVTSAPQVAPYRPAVANQIEELEATLNRANQAARNNQQILNETLLTLRQPSGEGPMIRTVERGAPRIERNLDGEEAESLPPPLNRPAGPPVAQILKNEGDDKLSLNVQNSDLREVLKLFSEQGMNILASKNVQGNVSATVNNVDLETALAAILQSTGFTSRREGRFVYVGTPQDFLEMDQLKDKIGTRIYRTNYVRASDLQTLITPMLTERVGKVTVSTQAESGITPSTTVTGGDSFAVEEVIMVRDYEAVLVQVDQIVEEVDRRPQQVSIEAMILTVKLDDSSALGVDFGLLRDKDNAKVFSGSPLTNLAAIDVSRGGLKFGFLDASLSAFVAALETVGDTNVVASPKLMCLNKQRAEILIGQQLGYISSTVTETSTTQSVQFLEVGTQLRIRPFISRDGMVRMEIHPELSTGSVRVVGAFTLPDKVVTQVTTNIMCRDGCTVVIGGLIREDLGATSSQLPFVGNLPLLGSLFRRNSETTSRNEIIVVITPRIVTEPEMGIAGQQAAGEFLQRQAVFADKMSPIGKRHYARNRLRLAQEAWAAGNQKSALRHVNMSLQFDPLNLDALRLQNEITGTASWSETPVDGIPSWTDEESPLELPAANKTVPRKAVKQAQFVAPK